MALNQNSFRIEPLKGQKYRDTGDTISVMIADADPDLEYVAGEAVILDAASTGFTVTKGADATADFVGVIVTNQLREKFYAGDVVEIVMLGGEVVMEAGAAVATGAKLEYNPATKKVVGATTGKELLRAMSAAAADGDLLVCKQILG